jgi:hypothetical protein
MADNTSTFMELTASIVSAYSVVVYSSMALFQIEPELDSTGGLDVAMFVCTVLLA